MLRAAPSVPLRESLRSEDIGSRRHLWLGAQQPVSRRIPAELRVCGAVSITSIDESPPMPALRNLALVTPIVIGAFLYISAAVDHVPTTPAAIHRAHLVALAGDIDMYVINEGHLPATLDDLPAPPRSEPGCIGPDERPIDDERRDPDGGRIDYTIVDARSLRYRIVIPAHMTKSGAWVPNTHTEESAAPASTAP
jgi:hypothetical protein